MKNIIFTAVILLATGNLINAQRQWFGQKGLEVTAGIFPGKKPIKDFYYLQAGLTISGKNGNYQLWAFEYARKKQVFDGINIPVETYLAEGGYNFYLLGDWARNFSVNFGLSATGGYETVNRGEAQLSNGAVIQNGDQFIFGGGARLSLETYLGNRLLFLIQGKTKYLLGTSLERFRPAIGAGLRYQF